MGTKRTLIPRTSLEQWTGEKITDETLAGRLTFSPREVGRMLGCSHATVLRLVRDGKLTKLDTEATSS